MNTRVVRVYHLRNEFGHHVMAKNSYSSVKILQTFEDTHDGFAQCELAIVEWSKFFGLIEQKFPIKTPEQLILDYRHPSSKEFNWNKMLHNEWRVLRSKYKSKEELMVALFPNYAQGIPAPGWLSENTNGTWIPAKGGYRFENERDAVLYRVFCSN